MKQWRSEHGRNSVSKSGGFGRSLGTEAFQRDPGAEPR